MSEIPESMKRAVDFYDGPECAHEYHAPADWPARFRAAAEVADREGAAAVASYLRNTGGYLALYRPDVVEAIGRALLSEES